MDKENIILRQSIQPYITLVVIVVLVLLFAAYTMISIHDYKSLIILPIGCLFLLGYIYIGISYRIKFYNDKIVQQASGMKNVTIDLNEISYIKEETSDAATLVSMRRPFRRIAIYAKDGRYIDVSFKHFASADIRKLMNLIKKNRSDLNVPNV